MYKSIYIQIADVISRKKRGLGGVIIHFGIVSGYSVNGVLMVLENSSDFGVREIPLTEFMRDAIEFKIVKSAPIQDRNRIVSIAKTYLGKKYSLFNFNCEHFVNLASSGIAHSKQVNTFKTIAAFASAAIIISKVNK